MKRGLIALALGTSLLAGCGPANPHPSLLETQITTTAATSARAVTGSWTGSARTLMVSYDPPPKAIAHKPASARHAERRERARHPTRMFVNTAGTYGLNLRQGPGTENAIILSIPHGASVRVVNRWAKDSLGNRWYRVRYKGHSGYVYAPLLSASR